MARIALEESQDCSWVARGWEATSFFVCFLYAFKAPEKSVSKFVGDVEVDETWDIVLVCGRRRVGCSGKNQKVARGLQWH